MNVFEDMRKDLNELVKLVRLSERYCTSVADRPGLATDESHRAEVLREIRVAELSSRYGVTS